MDLKLVEIVNSDDNLSYILDDDQDKEYFISTKTKSKKLNLLQRLILSSNNILIKNYLIDNIHKFKNDINYQNEKGWTSLFLCCRNSNTYSNNEIVKLLLDNNADPNIKEMHGITPLMVASSFSRNDSTDETIKLLLNKNADINSQGNRGNTSLMISCRNIDSVSKIETVQLLLNYNADPNIRNNIGQNALMILSQIRNQSETLKLLASKTKIDQNEIKNICLPEYKELFIKCWYAVLTEYDSIHSECIICADDIKCIVCKYGHATCYRCLDKLKLRCEGCQSYF